MFKSLQIGNRRIAFPHPTVQDREMPKAKYAHLFSF